MGKKYIIEIPEDKITDFVGSTHFLMPYIMAGHIGHHDTGLPIEPYTEPDLEQVRKEAYQKGYETGYEDGYNEPGKNQQEAYQRGLADAWDAARKIVIGDINFIGSAFGSGTRSGIIRDLTASEVIKVLKDYEQKQDAEIKIGNEVKAFEKKPFIVTGFGYGDNEEDVYCYGFVTENGISTSAKKNSCVRTGRHFDEIASIFKKMRNESNEQIDT